MERSVGVRIRFVFIREKFSSVLDQILFMHTYSLQFLRFRTMELIKKENVIVQVYCDHVAEVLQCVGIAHIIFLSRTIQLAKQH